MGVIHWYIVLTLMGFVVNLALGVAVLTIDARHPLNRAFAVLGFALSWWALMKLGISFAPKEQVAYFFYRLSGLGWTLLPAYFLTIAYVLSGRFMKGYRKWVLPAVALVFLGFYVCLWFDDLMVSDMAIEEWGWTDVPGPLFSSGFQFVFLGTFVYIIVEMVVHAARVRSQKDRIKAVIIIVGLLIPLVGGAVTNMILPSFGIYVFELAVPLTTVNALLIAWAIWRYRLVAYRLDYVSRSIVEVTRDPLLIVNNDGRIGIVSPPTLELTGYDRQEIVGMHIDEIMQEKRFEEHMKGQLESGQKLETTASILRRDADATPVALQATGLVGDAGRTVGYVIIAIPRD